MTATLTYDVFASLDGFGSYGPGGDWGGYWGKQGPELLARRLELHSEPCRMLFGATTFRAFAQMLAESSEDADVRDPWVGAMRHQPTTVFSSTLRDPLGWPDVTFAPGDALETVRQLKEDSEVPLRSHGSLSLNWSLLNAGLVDFVQLTVFPVISGATGVDPVLAGAGDFDLELVERRTLDERTVELVYRPTAH